MEFSSDLLYCIALTAIPGIGPKTAKNLISYCGGLQGIFKSSKSKLLKIPNIGVKTIELINNSKEAFLIAEQEIKFMQKAGIIPLYFLEEAYPWRLKQCFDSPILLYQKGNTDLNTQRIVSVIGTRNATNYGKQLCESLVQDLREFDVLLVSGLAYGIDHCMHRHAEKIGQKNLAVLGHGFHKIYPFSHTALSERIANNGALISEFRNKVSPDRENFPKRNRIIAGLSDATIVVETAEKGGSILTAKNAIKYKRNLFAFPGKVGDTYSTGCNLLIKNKEAQLVESAADFCNYMNWKKRSDLLVPKQKSLFPQLSEEEKKLCNFLNKNEPKSIDLLLLESKMNMGQVAQLLLMLELKDIVSSLPGKRYLLKSNSFF